MTPYQFFKRFVDFTLSFIGLITLLPIFIPIIIILKLTAEGEIFYLQKRMGLDNRIFHIFKFATMLKDSQSIGNKTLTLRNDPRVTKVGRILRLTKINELPQILNVLKGEMALVGPRPLIETSFCKYSPEVQSVIYKNKPGITGIGSLVFRDEEKLVTLFKKVNPDGDPFDFYAKHIYPYKGELELWYYSNISFSTDAKILFLTFYSILNDENELVYKWFKDLPQKPESLTKKGILKWSENLGVAN